jgi:hypothetical protein
MSFRTAVALAAALALCGCTVRSAVTVTGSGSLAATPAGTSAVLQVSVPYNTNITARGADWGVLRTQGPDARFADMVARAARDDIGLDVIAPFKVAKALEKAGLLPGLRPEAAHIRDAARAVGCASFLTAEVVRWQSNYVLFSAASTIEFDLTCHSAADGEKLWNVHVLRRSRGLSDGEVARLALAEAFQWLKANDTAVVTAPSEGGAP